MPSTPRQTPWRPKPHAAALSEGVVELWRADLDIAHEQLEELLSTEERERAARLRSVRDQRRWTVSRAVLRSILASRLDRDPRELRFELGEQGKPTLVNGTSRAHPRAPAGDSPFHFNLSHSDATALYALSADHEVGVDIERGNRRFGELELARRVLGEVESKRLATLEGQFRRREFLRSWVAHEAAVKCLGGGLGTPLADAQTTALWRAELDVGPNALAALAVNGPQCELRFWDWS